MEFTVDLKKIFGENTPKSKDLKEIVGQALIDTMVKRTQSNKSLSGGKFHKYSDAYAKKKGSTKVNLTLTSDMLTSIDIKKISGDKLTIAVDKDQAPKAFNHHTGDTLPKREWFGLQSKEIASIKKEFRSKANEISKTEKDQGIQSSQIDSLITALANGVLDFGNG